MRSFYGLYFRYSTGARSTHLNDIWREAPHDTRVAYDPTRPSTRPSKVCRGFAGGRVLTWKWKRMIFKQTHTEGCGEIGGTR